MKRVIGFSALAFVLVFAGVTAALRWDKFVDNTRFDRIFASSETPIRLTQGGATSMDSLADFRSAAKKAMPSIVSIDTAVIRADYFSGRQMQEATGEGSGVVLSDDGYIITNNHVITGGTNRAADAVRVTLDDGDTYEAKVIGLDPRSDLALLKIEAKGLKPIELGDSEVLEVGQWVMALGNPLGFENTLSVGVVSSLGRSLPTGDTQILMNAIQTDAAINPGNSGGALCDADGRLVGINTAIASRTGMSIGIGFAIPVERVKQVLSDMREFGYVRYAGLGVSLPGQQMNLADPYVRRYLVQRVGLPESLPEQGLLITGTSGPAAQAGIREGSVIQSIDGKPIANIRDYFSVMLEKRPGAEVSVKYWNDGREQTAMITTVDVGRG